MIAFIYSLEEDANKYDNKISIDSDRVQNLNNDQYIESIKSFAECPACFSIIKDKNDAKVCCRCTRIACESCYQ